MTYLRIFSAIFALLAVFLFGMWLTSPSFPCDRKFVAVAVNGEALPLPPFSPATLQVGRRWFSVRAGGTTLCNQWVANMILLPAHRIVWRNRT